MIGKVAPYFAFISQLTAKDMPAITSQTTSINQLKTVANVVMGRISGFNLFKGVPQYQATRNWAGLANPWTGLGFGMMLYGHIAKGTKFLPKGSQVGSIGKKIFTGGAVGGFFDAPAEGVPMQQYMSPGGYTNNTLGTNTFSVPTGNLPLVRQ